MRTIYTAQRPSKGPIIAKTEQRGPDQEGRGGGCDGGRGEVLIRRRDTLCAVTAAAVPAN